jgi:hypothetical protein
MHSAYQEAKRLQQDIENIRVPDEHEMRGEISRVASTLIKLMGR